MASGKTVGLSLGALVLGWMTLPAALFAGSGEPRSVSSRAADAYVLARGEHWSNSNASLEVVLAIQRRFSGDFLWVRRAGKEFLIRDSRIIDEAQAFWAPLRKLDPERSELELRQSRLESDEADLDREQEEIEGELERLSEDSDRRGDETARSNLERRRREVETRLRAVEGRDRELEAVERSIEQREAALEERAERELWRLIDTAIIHGEARPVE